MAYAIHKEALPRRMLRVEPTLYFDRRMTTQLYELVIEKK